MITMFYNQKSRGEHWRAEVRSGARASQSTETRSFADGDVWHSVWKRIETDSPVRSRVPGQTERLVKVPRDYVDEI